MADPNWVLLVVTSEAHEPVEQPTKMTSISDTQ